MPVCIEEKDQDAGNGDEKRCGGHPGGEEDPPGGAQAEPRGGRDLRTGGDPEPFPDERGLPFPEFLFDRVEFAAFARFASHLYNEKAFYPPRKRYFERKWTWSFRSRRWW